MPLAILDHGFTVPDADLCAAAHDLGFDGVGLTYGPHGAEERPCWRPDGPARLRQQAADHHLTIPSLSATCCVRLSLMDEDAPARLDRLAALAGAVGAGWLHLPCYGASEPRGPADLRRLAEVLAPTAARAAERGVGLAVEAPLPAEELRHLLARCNARAWYDVGTARAAGRDLAAELQLLGGATLAVVALRDRGRREPFAAVPLGRGAVPWPTVFQTLAAVGFTGWLMADVPPGLDPHAAARQALEFIRGQTRPVTPDRPVAAIFPDPAAEMIP